MALEALWTSPPHCLAAAAGLQLPPRYHIPGCWAGRASWGLSEGTAWQAPGPGFLSRRPFLLIWVPPSNACFPKCHSIVAMSSGVGVVCAFLSLPFPGDFLGVCLHFCHYFSLSLSGSVCLHISQAVSLVIHPSVPFSPSPFSSNW